MKKIGIVGGIAWRSTVDYYSEICRRSEEWNGARAVPGEALTPEIAIESLDLNRAVAYLGSDDDEASWARFDEYHRAALKRLEKSGAEVAVIASNTPHHRFDAITCGVTIPVISIFEAVAKQCARIGAREALILGTAATMSSVVYRREFGRYGVEAAGPMDETTRSVTIELIAELQGGRVEGIAKRLGVMAREAFGRQFGCRPVACLACTELTLAFPEYKASPVFEMDGVTYINTAAVHIDAVFDFAVAGGAG
jgi:aspartate racemase